MRYIFDARRGRRETQVPDFESGYCYFHANPGVAAQVGRRGGRQNRHVVEAMPLPCRRSTAFPACRVRLRRRWQMCVRADCPRGRLALLPPCLVFSCAPSAGRPGEEAQKLEETINAHNPDKSTDTAGEN